jgi:hypothetical protein
MSDSYYEVTLRIPKPHKGWLRFRLRSILVAITVICVVLACDEHPVLPWTESAARREQFMQLGDFEYLRTLNLSDVVAILGPPTEQGSYGKGMADHYTWKDSFGVPPFSGTLGLGVACGSDGEISAGGFSVNGKPYRP